MNIHLFPKEKVENSMDKVHELCIIHYGIPVNAKINHTKEGKPFYDEKYKVFFSVSHSRHLWAVAIAENPLGFDIEVLSQRKYKWLEIAKRFFTEEEQVFVEKHGEDGFLKIWVRKEACLKLRGQGLKGGLASFNLVKDGAIIKEIENTYVDEIKINENVIGAYCSNRKWKVEDIKIHGKY